MRKRMASACIVGLAASAASIVACGGGDDGGGSGTRDAGITVDASSSNIDGSVDAGGGGGTSGLGQSCTPPGTGSGQGDCPAGYTCLALDGASTSWCSKPCSTGAGDTCGSGYTGPGVAGCINQVTFGSGAPISYCGITCAGDGVNGCTTSTCTGACPGSLACTGTLLDGSGSAVGSACE